MLINGGIQPDYLSPAQLDKFNSQPPHVQQKSIATYNDHMAQQHRQTMSQGGMLNQGSPMMHGAMDVGAAGINDFYNAGPQAMRIAQQNANGTAGNHALQDYQMQLMLLEQQNKKRLMMARQEQNNLHPDGQPMAGQGFPTGMSPQGSRSGPSPNPSDQMKRGTPKMGPAGLPMSGSPMPEGAMPPGRGSPGPMNLNGGQIPPEMFQQAMKGMGEGSGGNARTSCSEWWEDAEWCQLAARASGSSADDTSALPTSASCRDSPAAHSYASSSRSTCGRCS